MFNETKFPLNGVFRKQQKTAKQRECFLQLRTFFKWRQVYLDIRKTRWEMWIGIDSSGSQKDSMNPGAYPGNFGGGERETWWAQVKGLVHCRSPTHTLVPHASTHPPPHTHTHQSPACLAAGHPPPVPQRHRPPARATAGCPHQFPMLTVTHPPQQSLALLPTRPPC